MLLSRARNLAAEHDDLAKRLDTEYDNSIAKKIGSLSHIVSTLKEWEDSQNVCCIACNRLEDADQSGQSLKELSSIISDPSSDQELRSLAEEELASTTESSFSLATALQVALVPEHPFAHLPCLIEIRPGAGGDEAGLFVGDLVRMYTAYCKSNGFPCSIITLDTDGSSGGDMVQEAVLEINKSGAYEHFRCESGVHRVQRVPLTETKGRTHTSAVSVSVLPSFPEEGSSDGQEGAADEDPDSDTYVSAADVRAETMRARGAGGQHVNTTDSAVRLTHVPTNITVLVRDQRSQQKNRAKAWQILRARVAQVRREAREEETAKLRQGIVGVARMGRGDKIRTYNWGQQRVTDHRCGLSINRLDDVILGGASLEQIMKEVKGWLQNQDLRILIAEEQAAQQKAEKDSEK